MFLSLLYIIILPSTTSGRKLLVLKSDVLGYTLSADTYICTHVRIK